MAFVLKYMRDPQHFYNITRDGAVQITWYAQPGLQRHTIVFNPKLPYDPIFDCHNHKDVIELYLQRAAPARLALLVPLVTEICDRWRLTPTYQAKNQIYLYAIGMTEAALVIRYTYVGFSIGGLLYDYDLLQFSRKEVIAQLTVSLTDKVPVTPAPVPGVPAALDVAELLEMVIDTYSTEEQPYRRFVCALVCRRWREIVAPRLDTATLAELLCGAVAPTESWSRDYWPANAYVNARVLHNYYHDPLDDFQRLPSLWDQMRGRDSSAGLLCWYKGRSFDQVGWRQLLSGADETILRYLGESGTFRDNDNTAIRELVLTGDIARIETVLMSTRDLRNDIVLAAIETDQLDVYKHYREPHIDDLAEATMYGATRIVAWLQAQNAV